MRRLPGVDVLLLVLLVIGVLEIAQTPAYDGIDHSGLLEQAPRLRRLLVPGEGRHPLVVLGKTTGPVRLAARSLSVLALLLYALVDLLERGGPWRRRIPAGLARRAGGLKAVLVAGIVAVLVLLPAGLTIAARVVTGSHDGAHDGGTIQVEEAAKMLLQGRNPYVQSYHGTPLEHWRGFASDAVEHLPYLPMGFLPAALSLPIGRGLLGWYDQRLLYLTAYGIVLLLAARLTPPGDRRRIAMLGLALNPLLVKFLILGTNDVAAAVWLVAGLVALKSRRPGLAGALVGLAGATKQLALLALPFLALHLLWDREAESPKRSVRRFLGWAGLVLAVTVGPFLIWSPGALIQDVILYPAGGLPTSFPIQGFHGYGVGTLPLLLRWVPDGRADFPFWLFQIPALVLAVPLLVAHQRRCRDLGAAIQAFWLTLLVFLYFARYLHGNFLGFLLIWPFLAHALSEPEPEPS